jgi:hypothetical protein
MAKISKAEAREAREIAAEEADIALALRTCRTRADARQRVAECGLNARLAFAYIDLHFPADEDMTLPQAVGLIFTPESVDRLQECDSALDYLDDDPAPMTPEGRLIVAYRTLRAHAARTFISNYKEG